MEMTNTSEVSEFVLVGIPFFHELHRVFFIVILFMYIITIFGNGVIPVIVAMEPKLQSPMYMFLSNLAFLEICYTSTVVPKLLQTLWEARTTICFSCCMAQYFFHFLFGGTELFILTAMSFDRYLAICKPLQYPMIMTKHVLIQISLATWYGSSIVVFLQCLIMWRLPYCRSNIDHFYCDFGPLLSLVCADTRLSQVLGMIASVLFVLLTLIFNIVSYLFIISTIICIPSASGRTKAFSTCASHLIVVSILYGALIFVYIRSNVLTSSRVTRIVAVLNTALIPMLNPFIYTIRNSDMKAAIIKIIHKKSRF
ncbi:olfactory receptor 6X1-like [Liasis olivaceus]